MSGDRDRAVSLFSRLMPGIRPTAFKRIPRGYSHQSWLVTAPEAQYLLKVWVRHPQWDRFDNNLVAQELARRSGVPTPRVVARAACPESELAYVQEFWPGLDAETAWPDLDRDQRISFAHDFGRAVGKMHTIAADAFREDTAGRQPPQAWPDLCRSRLEALIDANRSAGELSDVVLSAATDVCRAGIHHLDPGILPALTHRDLYLANTLASGGRFTALLDFEHARMYDPLWDFVKLGMWVFRPHPGFEAPFLSGYCKIQAWPDNASPRIHLYRGLEYLAAFPYFAVQHPDPDMIADFAGLLSDWLDETPPWR